MFTQHINERFYLTPLRRKTTKASGVKWLKNWFEASSWPLGAFERCNVDCRLRKCEFFYHHWALSEPVINSKSVLFGPALKGIKPQKRSFNDRQVVNRHLCVVNWCPHSSTIFERANKLSRALNLRAIASPFGGCYGRRWKKSTKMVCRFNLKALKVIGTCFMGDPLASGEGGIIALNPWIARQKSLSNYFSPVRNMSGRSQRAIELL